MTDRIIELKAKPVREVRALCGCTLVWVLSEALDEGPETGGRFLWGVQPVIVPCQEGLVHVDVMRDAWEQAAEHDEPFDLEQVLRRFEKLRIAEASGSC